MINPSRENSELPQIDEVQSVKRYQYAGVELRGDPARLIFVLHSLPQESSITREDLSRRVFGWYDEDNKAWLGSLISRTKPRISGATIHYERPDPKANPPQLGGYSLRSLTAIDLTDQDALVAVTVLDRVSRSFEEELLQRGLPSIDPALVRTFSDRDIPLPVGDIVTLRRTALESIYSQLTQNPHGISEDSDKNRILQYIKDVYPSFPALIRLIDPHFLLNQIERPSSRQLALIGQLTRRDIRPILGRDNSPPKLHSDVDSKVDDGNTVVEGIQSALAGRATDLARIFQQEPAAIIQTANSVVGLLPRHFIVDSASTRPGDLKDLNTLAAQIGDLTELLYLQQSHRLELPELEEIAEEGQTENTFLVKGLRHLTAQCLAYERDNQSLPGFNRNKFYQQISNSLRDLARRITQSNQLLDAYEKIGQAVEKLPGLEGAFLTSRISTTLFMDLGLPCLDYATEYRIADVLHSAVGRLTQSAGEFMISGSNSRLLEKVVASIADRGIDSNDLNPDLMLEYLNSTKHGEVLIGAILEVATPQQRDILLTFLAESTDYTHITHGRLSSKILTTEDLAESEERMTGEFKDLLKGY